MVLSEPLDKSILDVSKLNFDNVAQVKNTQNLTLVVWLTHVGLMRLGHRSDEVKNLMEVTREAMYLGIEHAVVGNRIGDIGAAIKNMLKVVVTGCS